MRKKDFFLLFLLLFFFFLFTLSLPFFLLLPSLFFIFSSNSYGYIPAYEQYKAHIKVIHFIGAHKPWHGMPHPGPGSRRE